MARKLSTVILFALATGWLVWTLIYGIPDVPREISAALSVLFIYLIRRRHPEEPWSEFLIIVPCLVIPLYLVDARFEVFCTICVFFQMFCGEENRVSVLKDLGLKPRKGRYRWNVGAIKHDD